MRLAHALLVASALARVPCVAEAQGAPSLVIRSARMLDTHTATVRGGMTIVIAGDRITAVVPDSAAPRGPRARVIEARGRLVTPAFVDAHHHVDDVFPDSLTSGGGTIATFSMHPDSIGTYRKRWAREYLPYGVAVVREVGGGDRHLALRQAWMQPSPDAPDFFASGGALVSPEKGRVPYMGHNVVNDSAEAVRRVREYHAAGLRDIKLYWRLRDREFVAASAEARRLGMHVTAHIMFGNVRLARALQLGVRHFEHAFTVGIEAVPPRLVDSAWARTRRELGAALPAGFNWAFLEQFNLLGDANADVAERVRMLAAAGASVTATLHIHAQHVGVAYFKTPSLHDFDRSELWTDAQRTRALAGYERLEELVLALHRSGVPLAVGTDTREPGKTVLSEILLLERAGIPMAQALAIASLGGARVLEREADYGAIDVGKKAHLVIFDRDPLDDPRAILGAKTVIKDGQVVRSPRT